MALFLLVSTTSAVFAEAENSAFAADFYDAVNAEWIAQAVIPSDQYQVGGFQDLADSVRDTLMADFAKMTSGELAFDDPLLAEFVKLYALASDYEARNAAGLAPAVPYLERVEAIASLKELSDNLSENILEGVSLPFGFGPDADMNDPLAKALYFLAPSQYIPDPSYYAEGNATGAYLLDAFGGMAYQLLLMAGFDEAKAAETVADAMAFDAMLTPYVKTAEESAVISNSYNPRVFAEFAAEIKNVDLATAVNNLFGKTPEQVVVIDPGFFDAFDTIVNEENFAMIKNWMLVNEVVSFAPYCSADALLLAESYSNIMTGQAEPTPLDETAYAIASSAFGEIVGLYYAKTYFGEQAKTDVTEMVKNMIEVYRARLQNNTWLSDATKAKAILKLDTMQLQIGYPDRIDPLYERIKITTAEEGGTLVSNMIAMSRLITEDAFATFDEPVDRGLWGISADTVNAFYNPMMNAITFPAAILAAPFYSLSQSASANYGGIGAVIAHEISHAFDPNGAMFDENGRYADWWTAEDYAQFEALSGKMVEVFDGLPHAGAQVNGALVVTENIADAGGLGCALEVVKSLPDADLDAFFTNWAIIWRGKMNPEIEQLYLTLDVHAPNKLRTNIQLQMFEEFFETYGIKEGDPMYRAPEDRVAIW
ncbi:MAG: M13 family metallopeptidase [Oscillospiraceae bacterium]|jgi:putative endopeptidase|nr:M13 family metallopeptidase [Oscillospiraceae bacterium]